MREIKFRGKTKEGEWVYGDLAKFMGKNPCIMEKSFFATRDFGEEDEHGNPIIDNRMALGAFVSVAPETVGQFTGLKDKNGKDIYEGDILESKSWGHKDRIKNPYHVVEWKGIKWVATGYNGDIRVSPDLNIKSDFEVIGNIHDNPELIK